MEKLSNLLQAGKYKITGGEVYLWKSFGDKARYLDLSCPTLDVQLSIIFDSINQDVYQCSLFTKDNSYIWTSPEHISAYKQEAYSKDIDPRFAFDDVKYIECDIFEDFLSKATDAFNTGKADNKVMIQLDLTEEEMEALKEVSKDEGVEKFIVRVMEEEVERTKSEMSSCWIKLVEKLAELEIDLIKENPEQVILMTEKNIDEMFEWVKSLNMAEVSVTHYDKETANGLICFIKEVKTNKVFGYELIY